jgi:hypothetical protein
MRNDLKRSAMPRRIFHHQPHESRNYASLLSPFRLSPAAPSVAIAAAASHGPHSVISLGAHTLTLIVSYSADDLYVFTLSLYIIELLLLSYY